MFFCIPCLLLIAYFTILSIFFPKYRRYLKEAWKCFRDKIKGEECSVSFDNRMRIALSAWLAKKGMVRLGKFLYDERNFNITLTILTIVLTVISTYLFFLMIQYFISPPCNGNVCYI